MTSFTFYVVAVLKINKTPTNTNDLYNEKNKTHRHFNKKVVGLINKHQRKPKWHPRKHNPEKRETLGIQDEGKHKKGKNTSQFNIPKRLIINLHISTYQYYAGSL